MAQMSPAREKAMLEQMAAFLGVPTPPTSYSEPSRKPKVDVKDLLSSHLKGCLVLLSCSNSSGRIGIRYEHKATTCFRERAIKEAEAAARLAGLTPRFLLDCEVYA